MVSLTALTIFVAVAASLAGATVISTVGFGIGMVAIPFLLLVIDAQSAVVVLNTVSVPLVTLLAVQNRDYLRWREAAPVVIFGVAGAVAGVVVLTSSDPRVLRITIVSLIIVLAAAPALGFRGPVPAPRVAGPVVGFVVALLLISLGVGGPIMVLYVLTHDWHRHAVRGFLSLYFLFVELVGVAGYGVEGLYTEERLILTGVVLAPVLAGFALGSRLADRMDEALFRRAAIAVIVATSLLVLGRELARL